MIERKHRTITMLAIYVTSTILSGCATGRNVVNTESVAVETAVSGDEYVAILEADAYQDGKATDWESRRGLSHGSSAASRLSSLRTGCFLAAIKRAQKVRLPGHVSKGGRAGSKDMK